MENYKENELGKKSEAPATVGDMSKEERDIAFSRLIKGEYKEQFQDRFNREFGRRFKEMKRTEEELMVLKEALMPLMERFNEKDTLSLVRRLIYEMEEKDENKEREKEFVKNQYDRWNEEATEMSDRYPGFDLRAELKNPEFRTGLKSGLPMASLYRGLHFDELSKGETDAAVKAAVANIRSGNGRVRETGSENSASVKTKKSVEDLTGEEIDEILERVRRGEKISFGA